MKLPPPEWIEKVIRIDSVTHRSNGDLVAFLCPLLEESGLKVREHWVREKGLRHCNLVACNDSPHAKNLLVLNTHLDTVSGGDPALWTHTRGDPYRATWEGDRVYGLGSADVKLDFLCKLVAIRQARPWTRPFALVGTYGEERGLVGAARLLESGAVRPRYALVGEPSALEIIYAHKGHLVCTAAFRFPRPPAAGGAGGKSREWHGLAAHSSTPHLGRNALAQALGEAARRKWRILSIEAGTDSNRIPEHCRMRISESPEPPDAPTRGLLALVDRLRRLEKKLGRRRDSRFSPSRCTISLNQASTEKGTVRLTFDIRLIPGADARAVERDVRRMVEASGGKVASLTVDAPLDGSPRSPLVKAASAALLSCGVKPRRRTKASCTEAALYAAHGAEALVFGPGTSIGNVHRPNEHNLLSQMETAVRFYKAVLALPEEFR